MEKHWDGSHCSALLSSNNMDTINVLVLGDQGVGKTSLINRFLTGQFIHNQV